MIFVNIKNEFEESFEKLVRMLIEKNNDMVYLDEEGKLAKALGNDWTKKCGSIDYDISSFAERQDDIRQGKDVTWKCPFCGGNVIVKDKNEKAVHLGCDMTIDIGDY